MRKRMIPAALCMLFGLLLLLGGCTAQTGRETEEPPVQSAEESDGVTENNESSDNTAETEEAEPISEDAEVSAEVPGPATLRYMGQGSLRVTTAEGQVLYIDPFSGTDEDYAPAADLILVTHDHRDHNQVERVANRNPDCRIITQVEALEDGIHQTFDLGYVQVEAVEAGYNKNHDLEHCVGYILTFSNGKTVYVTGDTSTTQQMAELAARELDYAFFCCDGRFNMDLEEAAECARLVNAKHNIPYHMAPGAENNFDREIAEQFQAENRIILEPGEDLLIE